MGMKMRSVRILLYLSALLALAACAMPTKSTEAPVESPSLMVIGSPENAILFVDGIEVGPAENFSGEQVLVVVPGRHLVEIRRGGSTLATREIFADAQGIQTIDFSGHD